MGSPAGGFWWRTFRFSWFGHQSRFDLPLCALPGERALLFAVHVDVDLSCRCGPAWSVSPADRPRCARFAASACGHPPRERQLRRRRIGARWRAGLGQAVRTAAPVDDLGLVDLVALVVGRRETGRGADRAVDVDHAAADAADQMVVVVADPILEASRRPGGLDAPDETLGDQDAEGVVHRLERDGADLGPDDLGHAVGRDVGLTRDGPQDSQSLGRDLNAALPKKVSRADVHSRSLPPHLE